MNIIQELRFALANSSELKNAANINRIPNNNRAPPPPNQPTFQHQRYGNNQNQFSTGAQPISSLNPYQNNWKICVRCTAISTMRTYNNQKGEGKLFSIDLLDADGGEIRAVMFNNAADKFFPLFKVSQCYYISRGSVRISKKGFSHITNPYQITLNDDAMVEICSDTNQNQAIEHQKFNFENIGDLNRYNAGQFVDIIGVVIECEEVQEIVSNKTQQTYKKRNLKICDSSAKISLTLWGTNAEKYSSQQLLHKIVAAKACKISDFGGRSLSAGSSILFSPTFKEAMHLQVWFDSCDKNETINGLTDFTQVFSAAPKTIIAQIKGMESNGTLFSAMSDQQQMSGTPKAAYFSVIGTITSISHSLERLPWYKAVPKDSGEDKQYANAKVTEDSSGQWLCLKNNKLYSSYTPRYILRFSIADFSGSLWVTAFNEPAEKILGKTAEEVEKVMENPEEFDEIFNAATFQRYEFRLRAKENNWEDQVSVRYDVQSVREAEYISLKKDMDENLDMLQKLMPDCLMSDGGNQNNVHQGFTQNYNNY